MYVANTTSNEHCPSASVASDVNASSVVPSGDRALERGDADAATTGRLETFVREVSTADKIRTHMSDDLANNLSHRNVHEPCQSVRSSLREALPCSMGSDITIHSVNPPHVALMRICARMCGHILPIRTCIDSMAPESDNGLPRVDAPPRGL